MQRIIYISFLFVSLLLSCQQEYNYTITGKLQNASDSLVFVSFYGQEKIDTILCEKGEFSIKGNVDSLTYLTILIPETGIWLDVWVKKDDKLTLNGDVHFPDLISIKGNDINEKLTSFKTSNKTLLQEKADLFRLQQESEKDTLLDNANELSYAVKITNIEYQLAEKAEEFIKNNPSSTASLTLIRDYLVDPENSNKMEEHLSLIQTPATESHLYNYLNALLEKIKRTAVGSPAPDFQITDIKGDTLSLSNFQDKYLLLTFAASWCDVCRKDNKSLVNAYTKFKNKGLQMFTVSFDEEKEDWKQAAKEDKITWLQAIDTQGWGAKMLITYNISSIPSNFLIDKEGVIIDRNLFGEALEEALKELYK